MAYLRDFVDKIVRSFGGVFKLDHDPGLTEEENVEQVITESALVAAVLACIQPIPAADILVLAPLQAKMTLHIGRIKGYEVTNERALEIVREIMGAAWLHVITQVLIGSVLKLTWVGGVVLTFPLNYAATFAIGTVASHYFDKLRAGEIPSAAVMRDLFVEQFRVGKERGEQLDRKDLERRAEALRKKVADADPDLATSTRLRPRDDAPASDRPASGSATAAPRGERPKIKIVVDPSSGARDRKALAEAPASAPRGKTFGPPDAAPAPEADASRPASGKTIFESDAPRPAPGPFVDREHAAEVARILQQDVRDLEAQTPALDEDVVMLEKQARACETELARLVQAERELAARDDRRAAFEETITARLAAERQASLFAEALRLGRNARRAFADALAQKRDEAEAALAAAGLPPMPDATPSAPAAAAAPAPTPAAPVLAPAAPAAPVLVPAAPVLAPAAPALAPAASAASVPAAPASGPASGGPDFIAKLERLAKLREQGVLSADEFDQAKRQLLR